MSKAITVPTFKRQNTGLIVEAEIYVLEFADLRILNQIGKGSFGRVFLGEYLGTEVAVKQIYRDETQKDELEKFLERELAICKLSHPNIVQLIGLCMNEKYVYLVTEYIPGGDLRSHLKNSGGKLDWDIKLKIALDIARSMAFLHSKDIIHRDLKSKNLLVDVGWRIKVCDFGFARKISKETQEMTICGTDEWMSPQVILGMEYGKKADVFSYGIVLTEIITERKIHNEFSRGPQNSFSIDEDKVRAHTLKGCPPALLDLAISCCQWHENSRPAFKEIIDILLPMHKSSEKKEIQAIKVPSYTPNISSTKGSLMSSYGSTAELPMKWKKTMGGKSICVLHMEVLRNLTLDNPRELEKALVVVMNPTSYAGWLQLGYTGEKSLELQSFMGGGGLGDLREKFEDDKVQYALLRIDTGDKTTRDIFISWVGPGVSILQKGFKKSNEGEVKLLLKPFHAELYVTNKRNFTLKEVLEKSHPLSGSHVID